MKKPVIRLLCVLGTLVLMACGAYALSAADSLVTLSYLKETFMPQVVGTGTETADKLLQETYDKANSALTQIQTDALAQLKKNAEAAQSGGTLQIRDWNDGDKIEMITGSGALMGNGTASVSHQGVVIDVTEGVEVVSGDRLKYNHRYLAGEDTRAVIEILSGAATLGVQGSYEIQKSTTTATPFYDVCQLNWYYAAVNYVYEKQWFSGMDAHRFGPSDPMNRAMMMTVLYRVAGSPKEELDAANVKFSDVPESAWYAPYVKWAAAQGISSGTGPSTFSPLQQITRQQVVVLMYNFVHNYLGLELTEGADLSRYVDLNQTAAWAEDAFAWAVAEDIVHSTATDRLMLSPKKDANRAEVATMLRAFAENVL